MHHSARQTAQATEAVPLIKVGDDRQGTRSPEFVYARRLAGQCHDAKALPQQRQQPQADIAAADDQYARPLRCPGSC